MQPAIQARIHASTRLRHAQFALCAAVIVYAGVRLSRHAYVIMDAIGMVAVYLLTLVLFATVTCGDFPCGGTFSRDLMTERGERRKWNTESRGGALAGHAVMCAKNSVDVEPEASGPADVVENLARVDRLLGVPVLEIVKLVQRRRARQPQFT